jgi:hypothetical protein
VHRLSLAAPAALLSIVLAACSSAGTATAPASASPSPTATPTAEPTPTDSAAAGTPNPLASFDFNQDKALEGLLPDSVGDLTLTKYSVKGAEFFSGAGTDPAFKDFLDRVHAQPDDVSAAFAGDEANTLSLLALRVAGANTDDLKSEFRRAMEESSSNTVDLSEATVGGKSVLTGFDPDQNSNVYFYVTADVLFFVTTTDKAVAEAALQKLP